EGGTRRRSQAPAASARGARRCSPRGTWASRLPTIESRGGDVGRSDGGPAEGGRLVLFLVERAARHIRGAPPPVREGAVLRGRVDHIHARSRRPAPRIEGGRPDGAAGRHRALG